MKSRGKGGDGLKSGSENEVLSDSSSNDAKRSVDSIGRGVTQFDSIGHTVTQLEMIGRKTTRSDHFNLVTMRQSDRCGSLALRQRALPLL